MTGRLAADFSGDALRNAATATASTPDPDPDDNRAVASTTTAAVADLAVTNTADPAVGGRRGTVTWTVVVRNDGPSDAREVVVGDELPDGVTLVSRTLDAGSGSCTGTRELSCTVPVLAAGASRTLTVVGRVSSAFTGTSLADTARVTSAVSDPDQLDNAATATSEVTRSADLAVSQTGPDAATAGTRVSWRLTVANGGPSDATGVVLVDQLPADLRGRRRLVRRRQLHRHRAGAAVRAGRRARRRQRGRHRHGRGRPGQHGDDADEPGRRDVRRARPRRRRPGLDPGDPARPRGRPLGDQHRRPGDVHGRRAGRPGR